MVLCCLCTSTDHRRHLLLLSPKADTHFTIPLRVEGSVDLTGWWLHTQTIFLPAGRKQSTLWEFGNSDISRQDFRSCLKTRSWFLCLPTGASV